MFVLSSYIELCYKVYFVFVEVGETCIKYKVRGQDVEINSVSRSTNVGKLVRRVNNVGYSVVDRDTLKPKLFKYYQQEYGFIRSQEYIFDTNRIVAKITKYKDAKDKVGQKEELSYEWNNQFEPYSAALYIFKRSSTSGSIDIFYERRFYNISFLFLRKEVVNNHIGDFEANVVELMPRVETEGALKPRGSWTIWVDTQNHIPLKMKIEFTLGSINIELRDIRGDRTLLGKIGNSI